MLKNKKWFTLIEMLIVMTGFLILITIIFSLYISLIKIKYKVEARELLIQNSYYTMEKLNLELKNYWIDYEEYFNRKMVWCDNVSLYWDSFVWDVDDWNKDWKCDIFTQYWNANSFSVDRSQSKLYFCSSISLENNNPDFVIKNINIDSDWSWCFDVWYFSSPFYQSFLQYANSFFDVMWDVDYQTGIVWDNDDLDIWKWPIAIWDSDNVKELYLISKDWMKRIFFRRKLIETWDFDWDWISSWYLEKRYTIQMLKLRWFDAWEKHNFDITSKWVYDWKIDTWACDFEEWFICSWDSIWNDIYSWFHLPFDSDDGWVDLLDKNISISDWNISVYPNKNPFLSWKDWYVQYNPYFVLNFTSKLYGKIREKKLWKTIKDFSFSLQSMFDIKTYY